MTASLLAHILFRFKNFSQAETLFEESLAAHHKSARQNEPCFLMDSFALAEIKKHKGEPQQACQLYLSAVNRIRSSRPVEPEVVRNATVYFEKLLARTRATVAATPSMKPSGVQPRPSTPSGSFPVYNAQSPYAEAAVSAGPPPQTYAYNNQGPPPNAPPPYSGYSGPAPGVPYQADPTVAAVQTPPVVSPEPQLDAEPAPEPEPEPVIDASMLELWQKQLDIGSDLLLSAEDDEMEKYVSAYLNLESALRLANSLFKGLDMRRVKTMARLGAASARVHMFEQAETLYQSAYTAASQSEDASTFDRASIKLEWAAVLGEQDKFSAADKLYQEACEELKQSGNNPDENQSHYFDKMRERSKLLEAAAVHVIAAKTAESQFDFEKAAKCFNSALGVLKQGFEPNHPHIAKLISGRARLLRLTKAEDQAQELEQRLERIDKANQTAEAKWAKLASELPKPKLEPIAV